MRSSRKCRASKKPPFLSRGGWRRAASPASYSVTSASSIYNICNSKTTGFIYHYYCSMKRSLIPWKEEKVKVTSAVPRELYFNVMVSRHENFQALQTPNGLIPSNSSWFSSRYNLSSCISIWTATRKRRAIMKAWGICADAKTLKHHYFAHR